jgi:ribosomal protein S6
VRGLEGLKSEIEDEECNLILYKKKKKSEAQYFNISICKEMEMEKELEEKMKIKGEIMTNIDCQRKKKIQKNEMKLLSKTYFNY